MRELASKSYWAQFERSPEFAVLFLPGDQFLSAALAERPELLENALAQSVIIATPSTLIALLKTVAYGWRQSAMAHNAAQIRDLGQELHRRLTSFHGHLGRMGQRLGAAVEAYNAAVGSLERQVLPQARRFHELGVTADAPLAPLEPVGQLVRGSGAPSAADVVAVAAAARDPWPQRLNRPRARSPGSTVPPRSAAPSRRCRHRGADPRARLARGPAHEVAHARLAWWREECLRLAAGDPQHPLTRALGGISRHRAPRPGGRRRLRGPATWDLRRRPSRRAASSTPTPGAGAQRWSARWRSSPCPRRRGRARSLSAAACTSSSC